MVPIYEAWVAKHRQNPMVVERLATFNLDEYVGLPERHPATYRSFMHEHLFDPLGIAASQTFFPPTDQADPETFDQTIDAAGGIDLQWLGLGVNGHIAFNEPGSPLDSRTRQVELTPSTRQANARFFESLDQVPRYATTMGIASILDAKEIWIMVRGNQKKEAFERATGGPVTSDCPASYLQNHPNVHWHVRMDD